jgi:Golgi nucleoside diphosphatase
MTNNIEPKTYQEAVEILYKNIPEKSKRFIKGNKVNSVQLHHTLGQYTRNFFKLWKSNENVELKKDMEKLFGKTHPDDLSDIILKGVVQRIEKAGMNSFSKEITSKEMKVKDPIYKTK